METADPVREAVRRRYAAAAIKIQAEGSCCGPCGDPISVGHYAAAELDAIGLEQGASLGCGNPTALAALRPGQIVLDLGSGSGMDVLLAARQVAPGGHAYGLDMTEEMLALAERNRIRAGLRNASFLQGTMEAIPLPDASVDVILSNCVINLAPDKLAVLKEAFRVLRPEGRLVVSDMVEVEPLPKAVKQELDAWAGCVAGTIPVADYLEALRGAGFAEPSIQVTQTFSPEHLGLEGVQGKIGSAQVQAVKPKS